ncbi:MAG: DUF4861 domain-containing protein [Prevotella sp.]|jgi:hypothetical protein|nr:DUF4861 domain-containing protein [Prevotella sp.]
MCKKLFLLCLFSLSLIDVSLTAQTIVVKNSSRQAIVDYTLEIPLNELDLPIGNYMAVVNDTDVPVEIITDIKGKQLAILPVNKIDAGSELAILIKQGTAFAYPKRTYAELSHKTGGRFDGHKYTGGYSWVKPNYIKLPGTFRDHSYYIKYEGPGWESDKAAFRFYLDNRNAIDVFGKKISDIVLPAVGVDGFDNYHRMADWGMDNMTVGAALGIGSIAVWNGQKAVRVEKKDSLVCYIPADGKIRSQVETVYYGWDANGEKCDLTSLVSIDAGSRASRMELHLSKDIDNIATGMTMNKNTELIVGNDRNSEWSYIATFGRQSLNDDMQGLVVFARTRQIKEITKDELNHVLVLKPDNGYVEYYFMPVWELDREPVATKDDFTRCIDEVLSRLNNPVTYNIKK